jgi:hypothetical protein
MRVRPYSKGRMSSTDRPLRAHARAEALLASLAGVVSANVVADSFGRIREIHILAVAELHPKQVVRNVESALSAGLGIQVDRRIVSVAQLRTAESLLDNGGPPDPGTGDAGTAGAVPGNGGDVSAGDVSGGDVSGGDVSAGDASAGAGGGGRGPGTKPPTRLEFVRFRAYRGEDRCTCEVVLRDGDAEVTGAGSGSDTAGGRAQSAARAVLSAIAVARPELKLELEGAAIASSRGRSYVIVAAQGLAGRQVYQLAGAAPLTRSPEEAAILATLQATNRWSG